MGRGFSGLQTEAVFSVERTADKHHIAAISATFQFLIMIVVEIKFRAEPKLC